MIPMTATKGLKYAGKKLEPGDDFDAKNSNDAKILHALKKAGYRTTAISAAPVQKVAKRATELPSPPTADELRALKVEPQDDLPALRAEYKTLFGKNPFMGWTADELRAKIAAHTTEE